MPDAFRRAVKRRFAVLGYAVVVDTACGSVEVTVVNGAGLPNLAAQVRSARRPMLYSATSPARRAGVECHLLRRVQGERLRPHKLTPCVDWTMVPAPAHSTSVKKETYKPEQVARERRSASWFAERYLLQVERRSSRVFAHTKIWLLFLRDQEPTMVLNYCIRSLWLRRRR